MKYERHRIGLYLLLCCALLSLGQSCGVPSPPTNPDPGPPGPPNPPPPPAVTSCGLIGNHCEVPSGAVPVSIAAADFDGDGDIDLAFANFGADNLSIALNDGTGVFTVQTNLPAGDSPYGVIAADFNYDGWPDLAVGNFDQVTAGGVRIYLNQGFASFVPNGHFRTGAVGNMVAAADLDNSGTLDLITPNPFSDQLSLLPGGFDGRFGAPVNLGIGGQPASAVPGDFDNDGDIDIAVASEASGTVAILYNLGGAQYAAPVIAHVGSHPVSITTTDLDGDGWLDLMTANYGVFEDADDVVAILLNNGDGTFAPAQPFIIGANPNFILAADLNGDGWPDIAVANGGSNGTDSGVAVMLNVNGTALTDPALYAAGDQPAALAAADLDGDGDLDLAVADQAGNQVWLLGNDGTGFFGSDE